MHRAAGLAVAALLAGCDGPQQPAPQSALSFSPDLAEDFAALPRIAAATPQAAAINGALDRLDANSVESRTSCLELRTQNDNVFAGRTVDAPMTGPRFVAIVVTSGNYCGGAHPNWGRTPLVFDLETGRLIDWRDWLPADMVEPMTDTEADRYTQPAVLQSLTLKAWFAQQALSEMDANGRAACAEIFGDYEPDWWSLNAWPDAKAGGLRLQTSDLAHASMGCHTDILMPLRDLKRRGAHREFTDALEAAHRANLWRDGAPETEGTS